MYWTKSTMPKRNKRQWVENELREAKESGAVKFVAGSKVMEVIRKLPGFVPVE
jgi:peroxiredoxin family protein